MFYLEQNRLILQETGQHSVEVRFSEKGSDRGSFKMVTQDPSLGHGTHLCWGQEPRWNYHVLASVHSTAHDERTSTQNHLSLRLPTGLKKKVLSFNV